MMASVLEIVLQEEVTPDAVIAWLQKSTIDVPEKLEALSHVQQEFIPFFLNYLRDHTLHLLQNSKSANPSPAKTPSLKKLHKQSRKEKGEGSKRQQLFGSSPAGDVDEVKYLPTSVFTPNTSIDSPGYATYSKNERQSQRGSSKSNYASQKFSPRCGSQSASSYSQQTPDHQRSKQKFSLGEFLYTPDQGSHGHKKRSPHSGPPSGRRDYFSETSPTPGMPRRSGGRKKPSTSPSPLLQTSPLVRTGSGKPELETQAPPVFCLASDNDFPPMDNDKGAFDRVFSKTCDTKASRVINFSRPENDQERTTPSTEQAGFDSRDSLSKRTEANLKGNFRKLSPVVQNQTSTPKPKQINPKYSQANKPGPRRITPTFVKGDNSVPQNSAFLVAVEESPAPMRLAVTKTDSVNHNQTADQVVSLEDRLQDSKLGMDPFSSVITPTKLPISRSSSSSICDTVEASPGEVTHQDKLALLVSLYSKCLDANLLPNLVVEFYFLVQLLTAKGGCVEGADLLIAEDLLLDNYFLSIHNTVYFAVSIFELQKRLLCILDRGTLRLLSENQRIASFSPSLQQYLEELFNKADTQKIPAFPSSPIGSVSFQADTDNRKNFPNDKSFHLFKRQRDGFYELIREWEEYHMSPNWNMGEVLGHRIRGLVPYRTDLANLIHFARLFQSQLIAMCKGDVSLRSSDDDDNIALLSQLKRSNPEKFKRLQERFIKPLSLGGPCPLPTFPGCQEFFRDFIVLVCNPVLNQHLCDTFSAKVLELNETAFTLTDDDDGVQANEDHEEKKLFSSVLLDSRLVAKFLGFVTFLPYQSPDKLPDNVESTYISIRSKQLPLLDVQQCLKLSIIHGKLSLTVPWLVEYLSMMDNLAPSLEYFQQVLFILLYIHRYVWQQLQEDITFSSLMIVALISWLLENPVFPEGFFFSDIPEEIMSEFQDNLPSLAALDNRNLVDQTLFYSCCPYVGELKTLLVDFTVGYGNKASAIRKITPISADTPVKKSLNERQLQVQMEENFFHNHPASMKRVVDFAADRTASNFIKKFRAGLLQESLTEGKEKVLKQLVTQSEGSPSSKIKDRIYQVTNRVAQDLQTKVRQTVSTDIPGYCSSRIKSLMTLLLPDDQDPTVVSMATQISLRVTEEKIIQWMNKHITVAMYQTEVAPELDKVNKMITKTQSATPPVSQSSSQSDLQVLETRTDVTGSLASEIVVMATEHLDDLPHPSEVLIDLKDTVKTLVMGSKNLSKDKVLELLTAVKCSLESRQDILTGVYRCFGQLTTELLTLFMLNQPDAYTSDVADAFIDLLKGPLVQFNVNQLVSARVVCMIENSVNCQETWCHYRELLQRLWEGKLLTAAQFENNFLKICTAIQDEDTLVHLSECLCHLAELMGDSRSEEMGASLGLLFQKLSGDNTPTEISGASTLTELEVTNEPDVLEIKGNVEKCDEKEKGMSDKTVVELERLLKALGLTNNNRINPFSPEAGTSDISGSGVS